jgi:hypothetical protein
MHVEFWWESQNVRDRQEVLDVGGRIIGDSCEHGNEPSDFIKF